MTQTLYIFRGLPASGKSTMAQAMVEKSYGNIVRIERDMLRDQLFDNRYYSRPDSWTHMTDEDFKKYLFDREETITTVAFSMAEGAFKQGKNVIISDTNLRAKYVRDWVAFAKKWSVEVEFVNFDDVSVDECIRRDKYRTNSVGEVVIRDMAKKFLVKGKIPAVQENTKTTGVTQQIKPYTPVGGTVKAILVDIDGTLAKMKDRSPYDWMRVGEDTPVQAVISAVRAAWHAGYVVVVMSGRDESCRAITEQWLRTHLEVSWFMLFMRPEGDNRADNIVKYELFNENVRYVYDIEYVLDDRDQVVKMWRELGLACFQVAPGAF